MLRAEARDLRGDVFEDEMNSVPPPSTVAGRQTSDGRRNLLDHSVRDAGLLE